MMAHCDDLMSAIEITQSGRISSSTSPPRTAESVEDKAKEAKAKTRRTRPMTEKRKMQNRESQRNYRERHKKYIEDLRRVASGSIPVVGNVPNAKRPLLPQPRQNNNPGGLTTTLPHPAIAEARPRLQRPPSLPASPTTSSHPNQPAQHVEATRPTSSICVPDSGHVTSQISPAGFVDNIGQWGVELGNDLDMSLPSDDLGALQVFTSSVDYNNRAEDYCFLDAHTNGFPTIPLLEDSMPDIFSSIEDTTIMTSVTTSPLRGGDSLQDSQDPNARVLIEKPPPSSRTQSSISELINTTSSNDEANQKLSEGYAGALDMLQLLRVNKNEENKALLREVMARNHSLGEIFLSGLRVLGGQPSSSRELQYRTIPRVADLHVNHFHLHRVHTINAYFANARALHFPIEEFSSGINTSSPFYRPDAKTTEERDRIMALIADPLPKDLRPTFPQLMYDHNPFLDVLPFPTLRARAIMFASCTPSLIDLVELKKDIANDGLICWNASQQGTGQPWDMRSWEAAPWFLDKWKILVSGEGNEVRAQSKWWRRLRGDERSIAQ